MLDIAPRLRTEGVLRFSYGDFTVELEPLPTEHADVVEGTKPVEKPKGIWNDPSLYGRDEEDPIPGIKKEQ